MLAISRNYKLNYAALGNINILKYILVLFLIVFPNKELHSTTLTEVIPVIAPCSGTGQVCEPPCHISYVLKKDATVSINFRANRRHCLKVKVDISGPLSGSSDWLDPWEYSGILDSGNLVADQYDFYLTGTGTIGGCNHGTLGGGRKSHFIYSKK